MSSIPSDQIQDAHSLEADAELYLYELTPVLGGTIYFKNDSPIDWLGNTYEGIPLQFEGESRNTDSGSSRPTMTIGDENIDLVALKPLIFDGLVDGAILIRRRVLLDKVLANQTGSQDDHYRVIQVSGYGRTSITLELARAADSLRFAFPFNQYYAPDFPTVVL